MAKMQGKGTKKKLSQAQAVKKWKGKDWFDIISPPEFGSKILYQTPSTDPSSLVGRNINVPVSEVFGDRSKYFMWLKFKIADVKGTNANTIPNGFQCTSEYLSRMVRKRKDKIEITHIVKTKDGWKIRIKPVLIMTRNVSSSIRTSIRNSLSGFLDANTKKMTMNEITQEIIKGAFQMKIKKELSKTYPIRFTEIGKVKVLETSKDAIKLQPKVKEEVAAEKLKAK